MSIYDTLNDRQREAVFHVNGPLLLLAGAGSGKTRVLTHRAVYLIEEVGVNPWNIMAITFTNKAAKEMRERIDNIVGFGSESIWVSTFHSSCVRILRRYAEHLGYDNNFTIYDTDDSKTLMKDICKELKIDTKMLKERVILGAISSAKNEMISPEAYLKENSADYRKKRIGEAYLAYQERLKKNNAMDFDDLLVNTVELFKCVPEVLEQYQERFRYIMVDEYQDTNTVQFQFVSMLAAKYRNLCVVGDDDQSIYKFRGANIWNILNFEKVFPDAKVIKLEQNYRSTKTILEAANQVIANNKGRKEKRLWTEQEEGAKIIFRQVDNAVEEAELVADEISELVRKQVYSYGNCACLYRTNAQSRTLEERFVRENIPYKIVGGVNFYQRKEIKDILAYLKTIENGRDDVAVKRIINVPKRGIGATTIDKIQTFAGANGLNFYESLLNENAMDILGKAKVKVKPFVDLIQRMRVVCEFSKLTEFIELLLEETGYLEELELENTDEARDRISNINELLAKAADFEKNAEDTSLRAFLEELALISDLDSVKDGTDYVVLMTVHSAKGLEFPKVFLCGMEDGLFPGYRSLDDPEDLEEERRLCYVAITRAMQSLTITSAKSRMVNGQIQYGRVSRFVQEIPFSLLNTNVSAKRMAPIPAVVRPTEMSNAKSVFEAKPFDPKQYTVTKANSLEYGIGDTVTHMKFGVGQVVTITEGGRDYEVTVDFERVGIKKMFASFAKLKKK